LSVDEARLALDRSGLLIKEIDGQRFVTSKDILLEEQSMLSFAREGRGRCRALHPEYAFAKDWLSAEQKSVVSHILNSFDRVILVRGAAGTGKTSLLQEAVNGIQSAGKKVVTLAPSAEASRGVLRKDGFHDADTLARFLVDPVFQETARNGVIILDEAGLVGTRTMAKLFTVSKQLEARIILLGDIRQHASVERGTALRLLESEAGLPVHEVSEIRRLKGDYKRVAEFLSRGQTRNAFELLDDLGWIREQHGEQRYETIALDVARAMASEQSVLVVSPTHAEGGRITDAIRTFLRLQNLLATEERAFTKLTCKGLTAAERERSLHYRTGDVVEFHSNAPGFVKGSRYTVVNAGRSSVMVKDQAGRNRILPLKLSERFEIYSAREIRIAWGDRIRISKNGRAADSAKRLDNGSVYTVNGFTESGDIDLGNGLVLGRDYAHFAYGYVSTSHASQGKTVDHVFVVQGAESFPASSQEQFYVSATRARQSLIVYTDDKAGMKQAIQRSDPRLSATELLTPSANHPAWLTSARWRANQRQDRATSFSETDSVRVASREVSR
jgi:ATP-dependent exoDNAse (exonuclease V) alpha subunit